MFRRLLVSTEQDKKKTRVVNDRFSLSNPRAII
jgi:hypothetical protein